LRVAWDHEGDYPSRRTACQSIAGKIGCSTHTLLDWVKKTEVDSGKRAGISTDVAEKMKALERENRELRQTNEILRKARLFCASSRGMKAFPCRAKGGARPPVKAMIAFIDDHRGAYGVEPICKVLPIALSTYFDHRAKQADPGRRSARARREAVSRPTISRVVKDNLKVYGARKVPRFAQSLRDQMNREGVSVARYTVERLMRVMGLHGVIRGKAIRTTTPDKAAPCPLDHVNRQFPRIAGRNPFRMTMAPSPNRLWVSDFTYVSTWSGFVHVAFVIDAYARRIVGWRVSRTPHASFVLDALEQALHERRPVNRGGLVHHIDRGSQYVSIKYSERLAEAGIEPSVGSVGDSYDNALAETINGLYKAEVIHRRGPWRSFEAVEFATLEWVDWFNHRRLMRPIGDIPPAEAEERYYAMLDQPAIAA